MDVPDRVEVAGGEHVILTWADGSTSRIAADALRAACECATCREPAGAAATEAVVLGPDGIRVVSAQLVGAYALNFRFSPDDHHTGIYPFDRLRRLADPELET